ESPGNRRLFAKVPRGNAEDVDLAVKAASRAFAGWSRVAPRERGRLLQKIADAVEARVEELARIIAEETGNASRKPARPEAKNSAGVLAFRGRLGGGAGGRPPPVGQPVLDLPPPRADRRGRRHHTLECTGAARHLEDRPGAVRRQHAGAQSRRRCPARGAVARPYLPTVPAQRGAPCHHRLRRGGPPFARPAC